MDSIIQKFPQVDSCCLCCSTETGTKIIGWWNLVTSAITACLAALLGLAVILNSNSKPNATNYLPGLLVLLSVLLAFVLLASTLLIGVHRGELAKVRLWLRVSVLLYIVVVVLTVGAIILSSGSPDFIQLISALPGIIIELVINFYIITVVKSYYTSKSSERQRDGCQYPGV